MSASLNGLSSLVQNWVFTRWHAGYLAFSRACFRDSRCCQRADALENLPGIEATLSGEQLPVPPLEVVTPIFAGDLMGEILRDVLPHFAAHDVVHRRERDAVASNNDRVILGMSVSVAGQNIEHDHIEQTHYVGRGHVPSRYIKHVIQCRSGNTSLIGFVLGRWWFPECLAIVFLVQAAPTTANNSSVISLQEQIAVSYTHLTLPTIYSV